MTDTNHAGNRQFAHNLFSATDDNGDLALTALAAADDAADAEGRRFAAALFAPEDPEAEILPGLKNGRTVCKWTQPQPDPVPQNEFRHS
jgi:hypothetical protein